MHNIIDLRLFAMVILFENIYDVYLNLNFKIYEVKIMHHRAVASRIEMRE